MNHTVVRDGNGRMAPPGGAFYKIRHRSQRVHGAHLRVGVKFDPFFRGVIVDHGRGHGFQFFNLSDNIGLVWGEVGLNKGARVFYLFYGLKKAVLVIKPA